MPYYAPFTLQDAEGNTYEFRSELDTSDAPRFNLEVQVYRNGEQAGRRVWRGMVPLLGMVRSFAARYVETPRMQQRYRVGADSSPAEEGTGA